MIACHVRPDTPPHARCGENWNVLPTVLITTSRRKGIGIDARFWGRRRGLTSSGWGWEEGGVGVGVGWGGVVVVVVVVVVR